VTSVRERRRTDDVGRPSVDVTAVRHRQSAVFAVGHALPRLERGAARGDADAGRKKKTSEKKVAHRASGRSR
jgi:hypothetical protein